MTNTAPSLARAAKAYECSRQNLNILKQRHKLSTATLLSPDELFQILLERAPASRLRSRLACPEFRRQAAERLTFTC
jgi:hypothetical protein